MSPDTDPNLKRPGGSIKPAPDKNGPQGLSARQRAFLDDVDPKVTGTQTTVVEAGPAQRDRFSHTPDGMPSMGAIRWARRSTGRILVTRALAVSGELEDIYPRIEDGKRRRISGMYHPKTARDNPKIRLPHKAGEIDPQIMKAINGDNQYFEGVTEEFTPAVEAAVRANPATNGRAYIDLRTAQLAPETISEIRKRMAAGKTPFIVLSEGREPFNTELLTALEDTGKGIFIFEEQPDVHLRLDELKLAVCKRMVSETTEEEVRDACIAYIRTTVKEAESTERPHANEATNNIFEIVRVLQEERRGLSYETLQALCIELMATCNEEHEADKKTGEMVMKWLLQINASYKGVPPKKVHNMKDVAEAVVEEMIENGDTHYIIVIIDFLFQQKIEGVEDIMRNILRGTRESEIYRKVATYIYTQLFVRNMEPYRKIADVPEDTGETLRQATRISVMRNMVLGDDPVEDLLKHTTGINIAIRTMRLDARPKSVAERGFKALARIKEIAKEKYLLGAEAERLDDEDDGELDRIGKKMEELQEEEGSLRARAEAAKAEVLATTIQIMKATGVIGKQEDAKGEITATLSQLFQTKYEEVDESSILRKERKMSDDDKKAAGRTLEKFRTQKGREELSTPKVSSKAVLLVICQLMAKKIMEEGMTVEDFNRMMSAPNIAGLISAYTDHMSEEQGADKGLIKAWRKVAQDFETTGRVEMMVEVMVAGEDRADSLYNAIQEVKANQRPSLRRPRQKITKIEGLLQRAIQYEEDLMEEPITQEEALETALDLTKATLEELAVDNSVITDHIAAQAKKAAECAAVLDNTNTQGEVFHLPTAGRYANKLARLARQATYDPIRRVENPKYVAFQQRIARQTGRRPLAA